MAHTHVKNKISSVQEEGQRTRVSAKDRAIWGILFPNIPGAPASKGKLAAQVRKRPERLVELFMQVLKGDAATETWGIRATSFERRKP